MLFIPQFQVVKDLPDDRPFVDEAYDFHLSLAVGTLQGIAPPDLLDALSPFRWWDFTRLVT